MRRLRMWASLLALFVLPAVVPAPPRVPRPERPPVLGSDVFPLAYDLRITPGKWNFNGGAAEGEETIVMMVRKPVSSVVLNAAGIRVRAAQIDGRPASVRTFRIAQQMAFSTGRTLAPGNHRLQVQFIGRILEDAAGLWPDNFTNPAAPNLVTLFEPSRARTLFPCFDEPRFRARFTLHVVAPSSWSVVSNMPLTRKSPHGIGKSTFTFAATPPIPPYLLTIDMGVFTKIHGSVGKTPLSVYIRPGQELLARSVLRDAEGALAFYERDFGVQYPLPKLDIVVASGVLNDTEEGPGAVTIYTEYDVSGKQFNGGIRGRQEAFNYVAEPLAQQWFGGLAGIASWQEAWLTTGLASWAEARAEAALHPEFVANPKDVNWAWNAISLWGSLDPLRKGFADDRDPATFDSLMAAATDASEPVADQWNAYAGDAAMRTAVRKFLQSHRWTTATDEDFWSAFNSNAAARYGKVWMNEPGAPVVEADAHCLHGQNVVVLRQHPIRSDYFSDHWSVLWPVPVAVSDEHSTKWILLSGKIATISFGSCGSAVLIDKGLRPQYPVHYSPGMLHKLEHQTLAPIDAARILRDTSTLYHSGAATLSEMLAAARISSAVPGVSEKVDAAFDDLREDARALQGSPYARTFFASVNASLLPVLQRAGFVQDGGNEDSLARIYDILAYAPNQKFAGAVLDAWRTHYSGSAFFPFSDWSVLPYAAAAGTSSDFDWALAHVQNVKGAILADDPFWFLAGARDAGTIGRILRVLRARRLDYPQIVWAVGKYEPRIISAYVNRHVHDILASVPPTQQAYTLAYGVANGPWTARTPQAWRAFFTRTLPPADKATIDGAMAVIEKQWALRRRLETQLKD